MVGMKNIWKMYIFDDKIERDEEWLRDMETGRWMNKLKLQGAQIIKENDWNGRKMDYMTVGPKLDDRDSNGQNDDGG